MHTDNKEILKNESQLTEKEIIKAEKKKAKEEKVALALKAKHLDRQRARIHNEMVAYQKTHSKEKKKAPKECFMALRHINKIYPNHVQAVYDFNLDVKEKEFIVLVGPSGCGKSTTLRMIAGLEDITAGDLFIDGIYANDLHPKDRGIAMVFQSYALYPHMSVADNMAFSLKIRKFPTLRVDQDGKPILGINKIAIKNLKRLLKNSIEYRESMKNILSASELAEVDKDIEEDTKKLEYLKTTPVECYDFKHMPKSEIRKKVYEAADILQIREYLDRKPKALSGGQCQRVALGRSIVRDAKVFLMDEPLSNLDAKLRVTMRSEIIKLHKKLNATTIYVTHDQTEAMTMATKIVVMSKGYVQQIDTPLNIYNHPKNIFVASFIGSPAMNLIKAKYKEGKVIFKEGLELPLTKSFSKQIEKHFEEAGNFYKEKLARLDHAFVERNEISVQMQEAKNNPEKYAKLAEERKIIEEANKDRKQLVEYIEKYENIKLKNGVDIIFGIRPEDIHRAGSKDETLSLSKKIDFTISVSELLGHEYYAHSDFQGSEIVAKLQSKQIINVGDKMELAFDMDRIHVFDCVNEETII